MYEWFTEDALLPTILGGFMTLALLGLFFYSSEKVMLGLAVLVGMVTASIFGIERYVVTDKERAHALVAQGISAGMRNDTEAMIGLLKSNQSQLIASARALLAKTKFDNIRLVGYKGFENEFNRQPQTGTISFVVFGSGTHRSFSGPFNLQVDLDLEMVNNQWKVTDYRYTHPRSAMRP